MSVELSGDRWAADESAVWGYMEGGHSRSAASTSTTGAFYEMDHWTMRLGVDGAVQQKTVTATLLWA
ncbi:hypothetical protein GP644_05510 [Parasedimentitalea maritima]|uniref:Uncharacterized protein n=1 Tax=Parasedimentitalea maritima TaxID=2578117 RepID=A0A6A4RJ83_9RHOB|nr:hypothetical protein GP644_05510 [Zongyanglinia marina]